MRPTSATGISHPGRPELGLGPGSNFGFTLIEILVVVAIIGIIVAVASVNLFPSDREVARNATAKLALAVEHARDAAWFGGRPTAISFEESRARLWRHTGRSWEPDATRETTLDPGLRITAVTSEGQPIRTGERLVFLPDGLDEPYRIALQVRGLEWAVDGDAAGSVKVVER